MRRRMLGFLLLPLFCLVAAADAAADDPTLGLVGHWPLAGDARDRSGAGRDLIEHGVRWGEAGDGAGKRQAALFDGRTGYLELPVEQSPAFGTGDFTLSLWAFVAAGQEDVPGDLVSHYDERTRRGWRLTLKSSPGVTFSQANYRRLQFGVDDQRLTEWQEVGRPGDGLLAFALVDFQDSLYAGVCRPGKSETGGLYRYLGGSNWEDCGAPDGSNTVTALAQWNDQLYVGTGKYRVAGSALPESENTTLGGRIFRYEPSSKTFVDCGRLPDRDAVSGLVVYRDRLYAGSLYKPAGFFVYEGAQKWQELPTPSELRVESMTVYNGLLYATTYDGGRVFRFDGTTWSECGPIGEPGQNTQTYAFTTYQGRLLVGTWPSGRVYRLEPNDAWTDLGRLGEELEVMGMYVHNGRLFAGTLPSAEVYSFEPSGQWLKLAQLDATPNVKYRRAWTMAEHRGRLFCSTLPTGKIYAISAGQSVAADRDFPVGWTHVAAVRRGPSLELYLNGRRTQSTPVASSAPYNLSAAAPLRLGLGQDDYFYGALSDVRLYKRALAADELQSFSTPVRR
ncbi:MAG: LamG-like jellyroll fold domain-containing protein [Pirellulales bacterium]